MAHFLTPLAVQALHIEIMRRTGADGAPVLDWDGLEEAVERPQIAVQYEEGADLIRLAAVLAVNIIKVRAFADGNKRTAYYALDVFLRKNGAAFAGDPIELAQQLEFVENDPRSIDELVDEFERWLRPRVV